MTSTPPNWRFEIGVGTTLFDDGPFMTNAFAFFQTPTLAAHTMTELFLQKILKMSITNLKIFINTPVTISEDGMTGEIYYT